MGVRDTAKFSTLTLASASRSGTIMNSMVGILGISLGSPLGTPLGSPLGTLLGSPLGSLLGSPLGTTVGSPLGASLGDPLGSSLGDFDGLAEAAKSCTVMVWIGLAEVLKEIFNSFEFAMTITAALSSSILLAGIGSSKLHTAIPAVTLITLLLMLSATS